MNGTTNGSFGVSLLNFDSLKRPFTDESQVYDENALSKYGEMLQRFGGPAPKPVTPSRFIAPPCSTSTPNTYRPVNIYDRLSLLASKIRGIPGESRSAPELPLPPTPSRAEPELRKAASQRVLSARENYRHPRFSYKPEPDETPFDTTRHEGLLSKLQELHVKEDRWRWQGRKYEDEQELKLKEAQQLQFEARERERARQNLGVLQQEDLRAKLRFEGLILERPRAVKDDFPQLPDEAIELINRVWDERQSKAEQFVEGFGAKITRKDLLTLKGLDWLNDEVINFYTSLICERAKNDKELPSVYAFNTFFFSTLQQRGFAGVKRWTRKVDIFSYSVILVPIHHGAHWCLAVINFNKGRIEYYDSMLGYGLSYIEALRDYLAQEHQDKKGSPMAIEFTLDSRQDIPRQMNGSDCGMFTCKFAEYASREAQVNFDQRHMPYFRKRMVWEITQKELM